PGSVTAFASTRVPAPYLVSPAAVPAGNGATGPVRVSVPADTPIPACPVAVRLTDPAQVLVPDTLCSAPCGKLASVTPTPARFSGRLTVTPPSSSSVPPFTLTGPVPVPRVPAAFATRRNPADTITSAVNVFPALLRVS